VTGPKPVLDGDTLAKLPPAVRAAVGSFVTAFDELSRERFTVHRADGRVSATVDVFGNVQDITIHQLAKRELDNLTLSDEVVAAIAQAQALGRQAREEATGAVTLFGLALRDVRGKDPETVRRRIHELIAREAP
jgi:DNA-binding protein YbaB